MLTDALAALREAAAGTRFALDIPGAEGARESAAELVRQLDDYVLPRLRRLDAPYDVAPGAGVERPDRDHHRVEQVEPPGDQRLQRGTISAATTIGSTRRVRA